MSCFGSQNLGYLGRGFNLRFKMVSLRALTIWEKIKNEIFFEPGDWGTRGWKHGIGGAQATKL